MCDTNEGRQEPTAGVKSLAALQIDEEWIGILVIIY